MSLISSQCRNEARVIFYFSGKGSAFAGFRQGKRSAVLAANGESTQRQWISGLMIEIRGKGSGLMYITDFRNRVVDC